MPKSAQQLWRRPTHIIRSKRSSQFQASSDCCVHLKGFDCPNHCWSYFSFRCRTSSHKTPSINPSEIPSSDLSRYPSKTPSNDPSENPSSDPSETLSSDPSQTPSRDPSSNPHTTPASHSSHHSQWLFQDDWYISFWGSGIVFWGSTASSNNFMQRTSQVQADCWFYSNNLKSFAATSFEQS